MNDDPDKSAGSGFGPHSDPGGVKARDGFHQKNGADRLPSAYEKMLKLVHDSKEAVEKDALPLLRERMGQAREKVVEMGELTREEAEHISEYLERDIQDAAAYLSNTGDEFVSWLRTDITLIEAKLLDMFSQVADQTSLQLKQWAEQARTTPYRTGEVTGPGVLFCRNCREELHFYKAGRIPPCPKCRGNEFLRLEDYPEAPLEEGQSPESGEDK
ncbi:MAG: zinc ribbon-containing protein [Gammaproteobacteria bacterium]|nr:zinc ribbon-containing protein [Gammaproteobacteria bacterium]